MRHGKRVPWHVQWRLVLESPRQSSEVAAPQSKVARVTPIALVLLLAALVLLKLKQFQVPHAHARSPWAEAAGVAAGVASLVPLKLEQHIAPHKLKKPAPQSNVARVAPMEETSLAHIARWLMQWTP